MSMHTITFSGHELVITQDNGHVNRMKLPHSIINVEDAPNSPWLFVVTDPPVSAEDTPNLFCIDSANASVIWAKSADKSRSANNIFTQSRFSPETTLLTAWDWDGYRSIIDPANGRLVESHFFK